MRKTFFSFFSIWHIFLKTLTNSSFYTKSATENYVGKNVFEQFDVSFPFACATPHPFISHILNTDSRLGVDHTKATSSQKRGSMNDVHSADEQTPQSYEPHVPVAPTDRRPVGVEKQEDAASPRTRVSIEVVPAVQFSALAPDLVDIYIAAMGYKPHVRTNAIRAWRQNTRERGFVAAVAFAEADGSGTAGMPSRAFRRPVGVAYGYFGRREQWWDQQLRHGLRQRFGADVFGSALFPAHKPAAKPGSIEETLPSILADYLQLAEIHVHPSFQGLGIGARLLSAIESIQGASTILLSTPEIPGEQNRAFHLYRRFGYEDLLRNHFFLGDSRPFAVLSKRMG